MPIMSSPRLVLDVPGASSDALALALAAVHALFDALGITPEDAASAHRKLANDRVKLSAQDLRAADAWEMAQRVVIESCDASRLGLAWTMTLTD